MEDFKNNLGKEFVQAGTGKIMKAISWTDSPTVTLEDEDGNRINGRCDVLSQSWELKKAESLSDKEWSGICFKERGDPGYTRKDLIAAVKILKEKINNTETLGGRTNHEIINEVFGEKLI